MIGDDERFEPGVAALPRQRQRARLADLLDDDVGGREAALAQHACKIGGIDGHLAPPLFGTERDRRLEQIERTQIERAIRFAY